MGRVNTSDRAMLGVVILRRHRVLPPKGVLLVSTDLHGNLDDFEVLRARFEGALDAGADVHWALLGDLVHGPDPATAAAEPELYGYVDRSPELIDALFSVQQAHPERVHVVLGNHDAGHVGLEHTSKFHPDEVEALEARLSDVQRGRLEQLLGDALLLMLAPCGLVLSHGSGGDAVTSLAVLDGPLRSEARDEHTRAVNELLWSYGQLGEVTARLLSRLSEQTGLSLHVVVHGHDRDPSGWFIEGGNQVQPVIFGALPQNKRYLWLDLGCRYLSPDDLREGHEVLRLHG